jgi:hypothetical protein
MAKKSGSSGKKHYQGYNYKRSKKPLWMRVVRIIALVVGITVLILAIIGMVIHWMSYFK